MWLQREGKFVNELRVCLQIDIRIRDTYVDSVRVSPMCKSDRVAESPTDANAMAHSNGHWDLTHVCDRHKRAASPEAVAQAHKGYISKFISGAYPSLYSYQFISGAQRLYHKGYIQVTLK